MQSQLDQLRLARDAERLAADSATTRESIAAELDELLAKPEAELSIADVRRILTLQMQPEELLAAPVVTREHLVSTANLGRTVNDPLSSAPFSQNARAELDGLRLARETAKVALDPSTTRATVAAELQGLLAKPDAELTIADVRRIIVLTNLAEPLLPVAMDTMPRTSLAAAGYVGRTITDPTTPASISSTTRTELRRLRIGSDRHQLLSEGVTPADVEREMRAVLAGTDDLDADRLHRLAVLDGLPRDLHRLWAPTYEASPLYERIAAGTSASNVRRDVNSLRLSLEAGDEFARNPATREELTDELARIFIQPNGLISDDVARRVALISRMPEDVRPLLPPRSDGQHYDLARVYLDRTWHNSYGTSTFDQVRAHVVPASSIGVDELVDSVRAADGTIELDRLHPTLRRIVVGAGSETLERLGINDRTLLAGTLGAAREGNIKAEVELATREAHALVANMQPRDEAEAMILAKLREQLDHSIGRIEGRVGRGYSNYVDYQNHGGAVANADLLNQLDQVARQDQALAVSRTTDTMDEALNW
jgi:hypothetical protein